MREQPVRKFIDRLRARRTRRIPVGAEHDVLDDQLAAVAEQRG
jgi:hypothetical protein